MIASQGKEISHHRIEEIDEGAPLTEQEKDHLLNAVAENDHDSWITHNGFGVNLSCIVEGQSLARVSILHFWVLRDL